MPLSRNAPLRKGASENKKRKRIRKYFKFKKKWSWVLFIIAIVTLPIGIGFILLIVWFLWWLFVLRDIPGDRTIDAWLADDIEQLKKRALQRLNLEGAKLKNPVGTDGPIALYVPNLWLWEMNDDDVPVEDCEWKKGKDGIVRYSIYTITILCLTEHKLSAFQCDYHFMKGVPLNEGDEEFYYQDIVAVSTLDESTNFTLPNREVMKHAQIFKISVSSGDSITTVIDSPVIQKYTGGSLPDTRFDDTVKVLRKVLSEKKS